MERRAEIYQLKAEIEVIAGPMFSGKSGELIERLKRHEIARRTVQAFKPSIDTRYNGAKSIDSHAGSSFNAVPVEINSPRQILDLVQPGTQVVGIDEVQFFDKEIVDVCDELVAMGKKVIVAGLPTDFRGEPFGAMPILMAKSERVDRIHAVCMTCGEDADFTQRIVDGRPANYNEPIVLIGASESYEARCRRHHEVPGKPKK